jgi:LysR family transcriptional regulator (chromosome initiation inhibitor)
MTAFQLEHLETLIAVLDEGTFDAAATRLRITASAVSQRVKAMEQQAGQVLVARTNPVQTTTAGGVVARYARQVALLGRDVDLELGVPELSSRAVAIAANSDSLATWLLPALAIAHDRLGLVFDVLRDDQDHTAELLRSGSAMAAVTALSTPVPGSVAMQLGIMRYRAVATPSFAARWLPGGALDRIGVAPIVEFDRKDGLQHAFVRRVTGAEPHGPRHYIPTSEDFARAVVLGLGWGMLPDQQSASPLRSGALVELAPGQPIDVLLHWQRWNLRSAALDGLTAIVRNAAARDLVQS